MLAMFFINIAASCFVSALAMRLIEQLHNQPDNRMKSCKLNIFNILSFEETFYEAVDAQ